ncbi:precorrin-2 dehydrogenase/sirohydrochlorin ferrochelatase family protein [Bacillus infantis]|uniref:precorrin-2 dehydrogenase/sirohydrochlorin ferrochelatase family protein n=1 Tax=Bacillus infantis TaxID=324767 RepID=UPI003CFAA08C
MQPLFIDLRGKKVVIAGGGRIAARKARVLEEEGADITFIAPSFSEEAILMADRKGYTLIERKAEAADFADAFLAILATNVRSANDELQKGLPVNQLVCVVDEFETGNVTFPARVRRGGLQIAVTSGGTSPKLTRKLKKELEVLFDETWSVYTEFLGKCRLAIKSLDLPAEEKDRMLWSLLEDEYRSSESKQEEKAAEIRGMAESVREDSEVVW